MKTKLLFIPIALLMGISGYAEETSDKVETDPYKEKYSFTYITLGASAISASDEINPVPAFSIGRRYERETTAIDVSYGFSYGETTKDKKKAWSYSLPKIMHIGYFQPQSESSFYYGLGASFSGIRDELHKKKFTGIFGNAAFGLEMNRSSLIRSMLQLDLSQPALGIKKTDISYLPTVQLSYGIGF